MAKQPPYVGITACWKGKMPNVSCISEASNEKDFRRCMKLTLTSWSKSEKDIEIKICAVTFLHPALKLEFRQN
jgi:hypothetical protein